MPSNRPHRHRSIVSRQRSLHYPSARVDDSAIRSPLAGGLSPGSERPVAVKGALRPSALDCDFGARTGRGSANPPTGPTVRRPRCLPSPRPRGSRGSPATCRSPSGPPAQAAPPSSPAPSLASFAGHSSCTHRPCRIDQRISSSTLTVQRHAGQTVPYLALTGFAGVRAGCTLIAYPPHNQTLALAADVLIADRP